MKDSKRRMLLLGTVFVVAAGATLIVTFTLIRMFERKQEAQTPFLQVAELDEVSVDPRLWGLNFPHHFGQYKRTADDDYYGGSSAMPESKLEAHPWLKRLYAGYAFSIDYREARGHAYMLQDQLATERVTKRSQAGACLHCHASTTVLYRKKGLEAMGRPVDRESLAARFDMPAVLRGFEEVSRKPYHEVLAMLAEMPDGSDADVEASFSSQPIGGESAYDREDRRERGLDGDIDLSNVHPVSCIDCHDPETMALRITRPGFVRGIAALAESGADVGHLPSLERWRRGPRDDPYDPNELATRQEMRSFTCGQCHVEYYCASRDALTFPWGEGLQVEQIERFWEQKQFPDGSSFYDYQHGETGVPLFKAQHPEFELWSQGIHARSGVACADCHMAYQRVGAMKISNHDVRSPMASPNRACQTCHNVPEQALRERVETIQVSTTRLTQRAAQAMTEMLDAILEAQAAGLSDEALAEVYALQRKSMWRLDYISSENSKGFHAGQEAARILGESIDYSRRAQAAALRLRAPAPPDIEDLPVEPVQGVTPDR